MSQRHSRPRQNVHRGRAPVTTPRVSASPKVVRPSAAVKSVNARLAKGSRASARATPGQLVAAGIVTGQ
jgi:hypothetical protein